MNAEAKDVATRMSDELTTVLQPEIEKVLPPHIGLDRFMRVVLTAISMNTALRDPELRRSLFTSAVKAATDGLVPDGREGAFVVFGKAVTWMPMVAGIIKKVRNSGELKSISSNVVYEKDTFRYWIDDDGEHVLHEPAVTTEERGKLVAVYAIAKTSAGGVYTEVMSRGQIEQVRNISRAKDSGPWVGWYDEMARKTVIRRLSKRLPMSTDLEQVVRRDDELYDLDQPVETAKSGTAAVKRALGLIVQAEPEQPAAATKIQQFDEAAAIKAIKGCKTVKQLDNLAAEVRADFVDTQREVPVAVTAAIDDRRAALEA